MPAFRHTRCLAALLFAAACLSFSISAFAAAVHGVVTDTSGAPVSGASVTLISKGGIVSTTISGADGSFQILTGVQGRFYLVVTAKTFRQLQTPSFFAGHFDSVERNLVLEPEWVRQSIVVTATGTPTPQGQTSESTSVIGPTELAQRVDLPGLLRVTPGTFVAQLGQRGAQSSLFVRGGNSTANKVLVDGIDAGELGGQFDFGPFSTTGVESVEIFRGANSSLYGADAGSSVVSITTPRGTTSFPSLFLSGDAGNFNTSHESAEIAGAHGKFDYLGDYSWFQTSNALPNDQFHVGTAVGNFGWQPRASLQLRGTIHYGVDATGVPNAWDFYHVADDVTQKDQDLYLSTSLEHQTTAAFHNLLRYGATRKREQYHQWSQQGSGDFDAYGDSLGELVTITGANGYSVTGQAILDYAGTYPFNESFVNNRDEFDYQGDYRVTPHLLGLIGFQYQDERGVERIPSYATDESTERTQENYLAAVHGDFHTRFFYNLGGALQHDTLYGTTTTPRAGATYYIFRPHDGKFSGTRVLFNFGDAVREPKLSDQFGSLYQFLATSGNQATAQQLGIGPIAAPTTRTYEGGVEQSFFSEHILFRGTYFHNQFGKEIESVGAQLLPGLLGLTGQNATDLIDALGYYYTYDYGVYVNTEAFRAQGIEATLEGGIGRSIFLRGGYTYLDSVVQRSFSSDNEALNGGYEPTYNGIPIGAYSPLKGARLFRRPPHTGFITATYSSHGITGLFTAAFASRSDDSTFLTDANFGTSLLLPNRNLDHGYAQLSLGGSYQLRNWLSVYTQMENLTSNRHIAPIGYQSLPYNARFGLNFQWTKARR
ncbi:MAG TPA: TonB-dependent receptor plug domain-containing protein [Terracidiphilus sp.]|nr:TonB-dependent receptor plug domain-containing protein [Terracidiphilus sp.]